MGESTYFRKKAFGGLHPQDVHEHIQELNQELEVANEKASELERDLSNSNITLKSFEEKERALKETMQMVNNYSHKMDQEAQERKNQIVEAAKHEATQIIEKAHDKKGLLEQDLVRLQKQKQIILNDLKSICDRHLALLRAESVEQDSLSLIDDNDHETVPQPEISQ